MFSDQPRPPLFSISNMATQDPEKSYAEAGDVYAYPTFNYLAWLTFSSGKEERGIHQETINLNNNASSKSVQPPSAAMHTLTCATGFRTL